MKEILKYTTPHEENKQSINSSVNLTPKERKVYYGMVLAAITFFIEGTHKPAAQRDVSDLISLAISLSLLAGIGLNEFRKFRKSEQLTNKEQIEIVEDEFEAYPMYTFSEKSIRLKNSEGEVEIFSKALDLDSFDLQKLTDDSSAIPTYKALDYIKGKDTKLIRFKEN